MVHANATCELGRKCECAMDPAVGLEHTSGDAVDDAVNGVAEVLLGRLQEGGEAEESKGELVVQPEGGIVDQAFLELHIFAETSQEAQHCKSQSVVL